MVARSGCQRSVWARRACVSGWRLNDDGDAHDSNSLLGDEFPIWRRDRPISMAESAIPLLKTLCRVIHASPDAQSGLAFMQAPQLEADARPCAHKSGMHSGAGAGTPGRGGPRVPTHGESAVRGQSPVDGVAPSASQGCGLRCRASDCTRRHPCCSAGHPSSARVGSHIAHGTAGAVVAHLVRRLRHRIPCLFAFGASSTGVQRYALFLFALGLCTTPNRPSIEMSSSNDGQ